MTKEREIMKNQKLIFDGGYPTNDEKGQFIEYLMAFYGKDPKWDAVYKDTQMGLLDAFECMEEYLDGDYPCVEENYVDGKPTHIWGGGDSIDREKVFEIYLNKCEEVA
jgi:hypothetical protein